MAYAADGIHIEFRDKAVNNWRNILAEAEKYSGKVGALLKVARGEYPTNVALQKAEEAYALLEGSGARVGGEKVGDGAATKATEKIRGLFLAANPLDTPRLRLDDEVRIIEERLRLAELHERFEITTRLAVRAADLAELLLRYTPHIVHFAAHESVTKGIILEDELGKGMTVPPRRWRSYSGFYATTGGWWC